jgi:hypothetical protein
MRRCASAGCTNHDDPREHPDPAALVTSLARDLPTVKAIDQELGRRGRYDPQILTRAVDAGWPVKTVVTMLSSIAERRAMAAMRHRGLCELAGAPLTTAPADVVRALRTIGLVEFQNSGSSRRRTMWMDREKARYWAAQGWGPHRAPERRERELSVRSPPRALPVLDDLTVQGRRLLHACLTADTMDSAEQLVTQAARTSPATLRDVLRVLAYWQTERERA